MIFKKKKRWHSLPGQPLTEMDKQVMYWENKGKLVPTRELIKTPEQIEGIRKSGIVNSGVLDEVAKHIHAGMSTDEIDKICYDYCVNHGAVPACLNYEGFPKSVCTSINEVVCHGIPKPTDILQEGDIVNVDFTTILRDLCGHGVGIDFHEEPEVLHFGHKGTGMLLVPGMVFTIEPMINMGTWKVFIDADDPYGWEVITGDEQPSAQWEHTFLMTEHGVEILSA